MNDEMVLKRLEGLERQVGFLVESTKGWQELKHDLTPIFNDAFKLVMKELGQVEAGFQLEDVFALVKRGLRSIRNLTYTLEQMENIIDLWQTVEPLLHAAVPKVINHLDELEQKGVFRIYKAMVEVRSKVAQAYPPEAIEEMGDSFVTLLSLLKKMGDPNIREVMEKLIDVMAELNLKECKDCGPFGLVAAMGSKEAKQGLGVMLELTKGLGKLKN